jgi:MSHA biogenesis protein MshP
MKQHGFSLIMALFLIVVLGGIAVFIGRVSTMQHRTSALDEEGAMAYYAARSGIEWGVYQAIAATPVSCASSTSFDLSLTVPTTPEVSTVNYGVIVACTATTATEGSTNVNIYRITSTANNATGGNFAVQRRLSVTVSQ